jgi:acyl carrier protein
VDSGWEGRPGLKALCGGEALPRALAAELRARLAPQGELWNLYGPTETAVWSAAGSVDCGEGALGLGRPIARTHLHVVDRELELVPVGVAGELLIAGAGVARGYWGRPDLTAERFLPDPWSGAGGARLYRTGDLVRHRPDGELEFLGRIDHQIKLRGFRIELGEIESVLASHPAVREAAVLLRADLPGGGGLVAYVVADAEAQALRGWLEERLPGYMVPAAFVALESLPLTPNGKVDRKALALVAPELARGADAWQAPRTPAEELLAGIWAHVLGVERVGAEDDFFALGGHSLLATRVASRLRDAFGVEVPLRALFEHPTVASLARLVEGMRRERGAPAPPLRRMERPGMLPLSFAQARLWFLDQLEPGNPAYNLALGVRLEGRLEADALEAALREVERRHEVMRTRLVVVDGEPCQVVDPPRPWHLPRVDLSGLAAAAAAREQRRLAAAEARRSFDLARGPLWRALLLALGERENVVLLTQHHIASDGWSMGILVREMAALYVARRAGLPSPLPELPVQYADFTLWQHQWLAGEVLQAQIDYWTGHLAGMPPVLELPTDRPRPGTSAGSGSARLRLATPLSELRALGQRRNVTLFILLMTAFQVLVRWLVRRDDIVVGTDIANRDQLAIEGMIGFFVNQLAIRSDLSGNPTFGELLARVREVTLGAYAHQQLPFDKLVEVLQPERSSAQAPIFQVKCNLQNLPAESLASADLVLHPLEIPPSTGQLDWILSLAESGEALLASLQYNAGLFDAATAGNVLAMFDRLLAAIVAAPESTLAELDRVLAQIDAEQRERRESEVEQASLKKLQRVRRQSVRVS